MRSLSFFSLFTAANAFAPSPQCRPTTRRGSTTAASSNDFESAMPETKSPLEKIGIQAEDLALGISAEEVAEFIGTKEDLIDRTMKDLPSLSREKAEIEVNNFLLDSEALGMMIQFYKMKADDPDFEVKTTEEEEGLFSFRTFVFVYLAYVAFSSGPVLVRKWIASQEEAGTWHDTNIKFIDDWIANTPVVTETINSASETVQSISETAQVVADTIN